MVGSCQRRAPPCRRTAAGACGENHTDAAGVKAPGIDLAGDADYPRPAARRQAMKNGFRVMDSDLHTMEPDGLWARYLEEPFKKFAPTFVRRAENAPNQPIIRIGDLELGEMSKRPHTAIVGRDLQRRAFARHPHYELAHARGYAPEAHVAALDIAGLYVATPSAT